MSNKRAFDNDSGHDSSTGDAGYSVITANMQRPYVYRPRDQGTSQSSSYQTPYAAQSPNILEANTTGRADSAPRRGRGRPRGRSNGGVVTARRAQLDASRARDEEVSVPSAKRRISESSDEEEDETNATSIDPLTFQCRGCFRLLGDSLAFVSTEAELGYVVLSSVSEIVAEGSSFQTSVDSSKDNGSTFVKLTCAGCGATLGRKYRTTPRDLDNLRDCFSLDVDQIFTYQLGSNQTKQLESVPEDEKDAPPDRKSIRLDAVADTSSASVPHDLYSKIEKTRNFTIELSDRLIAAEDDIRNNAAYIQQILASQQSAQDEYEQS